METPRRTKSQDDANVVPPAQKRKRLEESGDHSASQLPTPPITGREFEEESGQGPLLSAPQDTPQAPRRKGVVVMKNQEGGRKLELVGVAGGDEKDAVEDASISPRTTTIPALFTDSTGMAMIASQDVLDTEVAWLENGGRSRSPPSSTPPQLQTPAMTHVAMPDTTDSPATALEKMARRLELFREDVKVLEEPMVSTRIEMFGRVAVRKTFAVRFLGLDASASVIEEAQTDDGEGWGAIASSSRSIVKPQWPDNESPWALAGGRRKEKQRKEVEEKSTILRRYLEAVSDEGSEDEESFLPVRYAKGRGKTAHRLAAGLRTPRSRNRPPADSIGSDAKIALVNSLRGRAIVPLPLGRVACVCGARTPAGTAPMIECAGCRSWHHLHCNGIQDHTPLAAQWWCPSCQAQAIAMSTPAHATPRAYAQSDERSSAFKGDYTNIALAPSPVMYPNPAFTHISTTARTPLNRTMASPTSRQHRSRILSYGTDMWAYTEDGPPSSVAPSTPGPSRPDRFSTPRIDDAPFDVTSTPSRHLDFTFGQPSLFGLTPLGARGRVTSGALAEGTPLGSHGAGFGSRGRNVSGAPMSDMIPSRHDFLRDLNKGPQTEVPASPSTRWPHALLGAHNLSPSPFGHRRSASGNKFSSVRSSSKSGLGFGVPEDKEDVEL